MQNHYKQLIDSIFGLGVATFKPDPAIYNDVIGAMASTKKFEDFKNSFTARLRRIALACKQNANLQLAVNQALNQVADASKCGGFYAELAALDFLIDDHETAAEKLLLDMTLPAVDTLASEMGATNANLDCYLVDFDVFLDIKILSDKSRDIIDGIIKQVCREKGIHMTILPSFDPDLPFDIFESKRNQLYSELFSLLDPIAKPEQGRSAIISSLTYKFGWEPGVLISEGSYNPLIHAQNHHTLLFKHAKKFHKNKPNAIVFVNFPWFGERISPISNSKTIFYRELARTFFEKYASSTDLAKKFNKDFKTQISASEVAKNLSVVIFLDDNSILSKDPDNTNISMFFYQNETAKSPILNTSFERYLHRRGTNLNSI